MAGRSQASIKKNSGRRAKDLSPHGLRDIDEPGEPRQHHFLFWGLWAETREKAFICENFNVANGKVLFVGMFLLLVLDWRSLERKGGVSQAVTSLEGPLWQQMPNGWQFAGFSKASWAPNAC